MRTIITLLLIGILCVGTASAQMYSFVAMGFGSASEAKVAKTLYLGVGTAKSEMVSLFATGGYSRHDLKVEDGNVAVGDITGGVAFTPILFPKINPIFKAGLVGTGGVGLLDMSEADAISSSIALVGGAIASYAFAFDNGGKPIGKVFAYFRFVDAETNKTEGGVGITWSFAQAAK